MTAPDPATTPTTIKPFTFGLGPAGLGGGRNASDWRTFLRHLEALGYSTVGFGDHIDHRPAPGHAALAACLWTDRLRGAVHVHANDFHHPVVLARELAAVAMLSDGRFDAGIGAGWMAQDYRRLGLSFDPPGERISRLAEAVTLMKRMWREESVSFDGRHYHVEEVTGSPLLSGVAPPRLVMGGGGERMLALAAKEADVISVNVRLESGQLGPERGATATIEGAHHKVAVIRKAAGPRFDDLVLQVELHYVEVTDDRRGALERASVTVGIPVEEADVSPHVLVGTPAHMAEQLLERRADLGLSYICMSAASADEFAPVVELLAGS